MHLRPGRLASLRATAHDVNVDADGQCPLPHEDAELIARVRAADPEALATFHQRFAQPVLRILLRIMGPDRELEDLHHDVFVRALQSLPALREPSALRGFMTAIAVNTARACLERRIRRRRWMFLAPADSLPEPVPWDPGPDHEARAALRSVYRLLGQLPVAERIAFTLRYFHQMELTEVAQACDVSLASIKRRLARAEGRFLALARRTPELTEYLRGGARWTLG